MMAESEDLQEEFARDLHATGTLGGYAHGNIHTVYTNTNEERCITIVRDSVLGKRLLCSICPTNNRSADSMRCGDAYQNASKHLGSRGHYAAYQRWAYGLPYDEESWFVRTAGNQRRRRYEWRAAPAATCLAAYGSPGPRARATDHSPTLSTNRHGPKGRSQALKRKEVAAARI